MEKINQQLSEQIQFNLVQPGTTTNAAAAVAQASGNPDVIKQIQVSGGSLNEEEAHFLTRL